MHFEYRQVPGLMWDLKLYLML